MNNGPKFGLNTSVAEKILFTINVVQASYNGNTYSFSRFIFYSAIAYKCEQISQFLILKRG